MSQSPLLAVVGASGGLGASTLALAVGRRLARGRTVVVADLDLAGGGLEVTAGVEHLPGRRWHELAGVSGRVPSTRLVASLPGEDGCHVLSGMGGACPEVPPGAVLDVLDSLVGGGVPVVVDLPGGSALLPEVVARADVVCVLVALRTRGLADAEATVERVMAAGAGGDGWAAGGPEAAGPAGDVRRADGSARRVPAEPTGPVLHLVTRGARPTADVLDDVVAHLGVGHLHHVPDDVRVARDAERGLFPGVSRDAVRRCADAVVEVLAPVAVAS